MKDLNQPQTLTLLSGAAALACLALAGPAQAHNLSSHAGLTAGFLHPLLGVDHLLLLLAVGTAAAAMTPWLLAWALAGGLIGGVLGATGTHLPAQELLAALAISAVALLARQAKRPDHQSLGMAGSLVALAVALHAMLHGQEAPQDAGTTAWWLGALLTSALVGGGSFALLRRLPVGWTQRLGLLLVVLGGAAALSL